MRSLSLTALPYVACTVPLALYQLLYVNAFYPITEGWFSEYAHLIRAGAVPYRDFSLLLPPLYPVQIAVFQSIFGEGFFALNALGILVTCAIAVALFDLLNNFFDPWICAFAATVGTIYYQSGNAFINYDFTQFVTLYLLIATALLLRSIKPPPATGSESSALWLCAASGLFLSLAFLIKQSNGGVAALAVGLASAIVAIALYRQRAAILRMAALAGGFCLPVALTLLWLGATGALRPFFADVIVAALHVKGGLSIFAWIGYYFAFVRWFGGQAATYLLELLAAMMLGPVIMEGLVAVRNRRNMDRAQLLGALRGIIGFGRVTRRAGLISLVALGALCVLVLAARRGLCAHCLAQPAGMNVKNFIYAWAPLFYLVGSLVSLVLLVRSRRARAAQFFVIAMLGVGLTLGNGMSSSVSEISIFLAIAVLTAFLFDVGLPYIFPALLPVALALLFCAFYVGSKFSAPYTWWLVTTPPVGSTPCAEARGVFRGLCIPPRDYASIMSVENEILANSSVGTPIYVYPHMPIFYLLTNRPPFDGAVVSWFDATSDEQADEVSKDLRTSPPAVIVMAEIPEAVMIAHEHLFRSGTPLHQRKILAAIVYHRSAGVLQLIQRIRNLNGLTVDVYRSQHR